MTTNLLTIIMSYTSIDIGELSQLANMILDILSQLQTLYKEHSVLPIIDAFLVGQVKSGF